MKTKILYHSVQYYTFSAASNYMVDNYEIENYTIGQLPRVSGKDPERNRVDFSF